MVVCPYSPLAAVHTPLPPVAGSRPSPFRQGARHLLPLPSVVVRPLSPSGGRSSPPLTATSTGWLTLPNRWRFLPPFPCGGGSPSNPFGVGFFSMFALFFVFASAILACTYKWIVSVIFFSTNPCSQKHNTETTQHTYFKKFKSFKRSETSKGAQFSKFCFSFAVDSSKLKTV